MRIFKLELEVLNREVVFLTGLSYQSYFLNMEKLNFLNHLLILFALSSPVLLLLTLVAENCNELYKNNIAPTDQ